MHLAVVTCEHAVRTVPPAFARLFEEADAVLNSHRGWDPDTLELGRDLRAALQVPLVRGEVTRLLVDLNRSTHHPEVWSEFSRGLSDNQRMALLERYYHPYRSLVRRHFDNALRLTDRALHLSVHSFTPVWHGEEREVDIGLLYDPARPAEAEFCAEWADALRTALPGLRICHNKPYNGTDDGLTTALRSYYPPNAYLGIEIEVNQRYPFGCFGLWQQVRAGIVDSLKRVSGQ